MSDFNERLARLADQVRAIDGGSLLAMDLMQLAGAIDGYLEQQLSERNKKLNTAFTAWNAFLNGSLESAYDEADRKIAIERRRFARTVASDPRWQGGYADALKLLAGDEAKQYEES